VRRCRAMRRAARCQPVGALVSGLLLTILVANHFRNTANYTRNLMEANERLVLEIGERYRIASSLRENERFLATCSATCLAWYTAAVMMRTGPRCSPATDAWR